MELTQEQIKLAFGSHLQAIRKAKKLSIRKLALMADLDHSQIRKIEKGEVSPTIVTFYAILEGMEVTPCEFFACK